MVDTKSSIDKKITLIHYLLTTIERKVRQTFRFHQFDNTMQKLFSSSVIKSSFQILMKNIGCSNCVIHLFAVPWSLEFGKWPSTCQESRQSQVSRSVICSYYNYQKEPQFPHHFLQCNQTSYFHFINQFDGVGVGSECAQDGSQGHREGAGPPQEPSVPDGWTTRQIRYRHEKLRDGSGLQLFRTWRFFKGNENQGDIYR